jgi:hypothetical protein
MRSANPSSVVFSGTIEPSEPKRLRNRNKIGRRDSIEMHKPRRKSIVAKTTICILLETVARPQRKAAVQIWQ